MYYTLIHALQNDRKSAGGYLKQAVSSFIEHDDQPIGVKKDGLMSRIEEFETIGKQISGCHKAYSFAHMRSLQAETDHQVAETVAVNAARCFAELPGNLNYIDLMQALEGLNYAKVALVDARNAFHETERVLEETDIDKVKFCPVCHMPIAARCKCDTSAAGKE